MERSPEDTVLDDAIVGIEKIQISPTKQSSGVSGCKDGDGQPQRSQILSPKSYIGNDNCLRCFDASNFKACGILPYRLSKCGLSFEALMGVNINELNLLGGKREYPETSAQTGFREFFEETGGSLSLHQKMCLESELSRGSNSCEIVWLAHKVSPPKFALYLLCIDLIGDEELRHGLLTLDATFRDPQQVLYRRQLPSSFNEMSSLEWIPMECLFGSERLPRQRRFRNFINLCVCKEVVLRVWYGTRKSQLSMIQKRSHQPVAKTPLKYQAHENPSMITPKTAQLQFPPDSHRIDPHFSAKAGVSQTAESKLLHVSKPSPTGDMLCSMEIPVAVTRRRRILLRQIERLLSQCEQAIEVIADISGCQCCLIRLQAPSERHLCDVKIQGRALESVEICELLLMAAIHEGSIDAVGDVAALTTMARRMNARKSILEYAMAMSSSSTVLS